MEMPRFPFVYLNMVALLCLCFSQFCYSQDWSSVMSILVEATEGSEEEISLLEDLFYSKYNLNELNEQDCQQFFFLSDFEKQSLLYYVEHNKPLFSVYELQNVLGLPIEKASLLAMFCVVLPVSGHRTLSDLMERGKHTLSMNLSLSNISNREYKELYGYVGSAVKEVFRYRFQSENSLYAGFTMKKDKGERLSFPEGYDSKSAYVQLKPRGYVSNVVLGDYEVRIGQGLIFSQGGYFSSSVEPSGGMQSYVLSKHSSASEYTFLRGGGVTMNLGRFQVTPFLSFRKLDGKIKMEDEFPFTIHSTGYHRTLAECAAKQQISYRVFGTNLHLDWDRLRINTAVLQQIFSSDTICAKIQNASMSYSYRKRHLKLFGELAFDAHYGFATIQGLYCAMADEVVVSSHVRYFQPEYQSFMSYSMGRQSSVKNEMGWRTSVRLGVTSHITLYVDNDLYTIPCEHGTIKTPTRGDVFRFKFLYKRSDWFTAYYQYTLTSKTEKLEVGYEMEKKHRHTLHVSYMPCTRIQLASAMQVHSQDGKTGFLFYEDCVWKPSQLLSFSLRFAQFDASYEQRLYAWENDVSYTFSSLQFMYAGTYWSLLAKWKISRHWIFQAKIMQTRYTDSYELPDSYDLYGNSRKLMCNLMLQFII